MILNVKEALNQSGLRGEHMNNEDPDIEFYLA